ncbi:MAG: TIGR01212 family radical SAM protein [Waddliaceae bacterium]
MPQEKQKRLYTSYNEYLQRMFGCRVYKVSVDAGFTCPNRDGTKGFGGCIFCDETGSSSRTHLLTTPIKEQILGNIKVRKSRYKAKKFIVYFQSYTNTYGSVEHLKTLYDEALDVHPDIVGLAISTRPDCVNKEKLELIASCREKVPYVCVEYGMQTRHNRTLKTINRCEAHVDFLHAIQLTKDCNLDNCVHIILGLPGETREEQLKTADTLAKLKVGGIKIHLLVAMENTPLASLYHTGKWSPLSFEEYIALACDFIERLHPECVIHRVSGNGHPEHIVAPQWMIGNKKGIMSSIQSTLIERGTQQGSKCRHTD